MATPASYEQLIAQKLDQAPLPDLADSIWASIEAQLDAPLPGEGDKELPAKKHPRKGLPGRDNLLYIALPAILLTAAWLYFKYKKQHRSEKNSPALQVPPPAVTADSTTNATTPAQMPGNSFSNKKKEDSVAYPGSIITPPLLIDSPQIPPVSIPTDDSVSFNPPPMVVTGKDTAVKTPSLKKPKGVKGITDADYKVISERKDSVKKDH